MTKEEIKQAKKKLKNEVTVCLVGKKINKVYTFTIPAGYDYDGASIPRFLWRFIGAKESIEFKVAALVHDVLCENHHYVDNNRYFADKHNDLIERMVRVEDSTKSAHHRLDGLERK